MCGCIGVLDREGNARKVVNCSCVVVRDWGEESQERSILLNYFQTEQQSDGVLDNVIRGMGLWRTAYAAAQRIRYRKARKYGLEGESSAVRMSFNCTLFQFEEYYGYEKH